jgi:hypothetical protein
MPDSNPDLEAKTGQLDADRVLKERTERYTEAEKIAEGARGAGEATGEGAALAAAGQSTRGSGLPAAQDPSVVDVLENKERLEAITASGGIKPGESGEPDVHQILAKIDTAQLNKNQGEIDRLTQQLADLGFDIGGGGGEGGSGGESGGDAGSKDNPPPAPETTSSTQTGTPASGTTASSEKSRSGGSGKSGGKG